MNGRDAVRRLTRRILRRELTRVGGARVRLPAPLAARLAPLVVDTARRMSDLPADEVLRLLRRARGSLAPAAAVAGLEPAIAARDAAATRELWSRADRVLAARLAPRGAIEAALLEGSPDRAGRDSAADTWGMIRGAEPAAEVLAAVAGRLLAGGRPELASEALEAAAAAGDAADPSARRAREWVAQWIPVPAAIDVGDDPPALAIFDYRHADRSRASTNLGDWLQTDALLGHLVRQDRLRLETSDPELSSALETLRAGVNDRRRRDAVRGALRVVPVDRDFSSFRPVAGRPWLIVYGWYMDALVGDRFDFPFSSAFRTLFVSFHVQDHRLLTAEAVDALRASAPIGCRDGATVRLLRDRGIPAFFSGCLTTTVDTLFPERVAPAASAPTAFVDTLPTEADDTGAISLWEQSDVATLERTFPENLLAARDFMAELSRGYHRVVTSRLHAYLPSRSLGVPVEFRPADRSDSRFAGLAFITAEAFDAIREALLTRIEQTLAAIVTGQDERTVRELWARLWAAELAAEPPGVASSD